MKFAVAALCLLAIAAVAVAYEPRLDALIDEVNSDPSSSWVAGRNKFFEKHTIADIKRMLGFKPNRDAHVGRPVKTFSDFDNTFTDIPTNFSAVEQWPNCTSIGAIQNQGSCGSCWAFGAVETITDRFCIYNGGVSPFEGELSFQDMTSCGPCAGCNGGDAAAAFDFAKDVGLVLNSAYPYGEPTCAPSQQPCEPPFSPTAKCKPPKNATTYTLSSAYHVHAGLFPIGGDIQKEMVQNGPVEMCFNVYEDFVNYKSGVYEHKSGSLLGGHCVKGVGFGETADGTKYWEINNSWTTTWGNNGTFRIKRGVDECGIEGDVEGGVPNIPDRR